MVTSKLLWLVLASQIFHSSLAADLHPTDIFILAGQSNMAGRGGVDNVTWNGFIPTQCSSNPSILRLSAQLKWEEAREPLHVDIDLEKTCGIGPGMAFANAVKANESRIGVVGLVPCAIGGTAISEWARGTRLYKELVNRAKESVRYGGIIRAILWFQGESDTGRKKDAEAYKGNMESLIRSLRYDLNISDIPVIQVGIFDSHCSFNSNAKQTYDRGKD